MLDGWKKQLIGKLSNVTSGGTPSTSVSDYWNGNILWMNSGELNNKKIYGVKGRITELGLNNSSTHLIPARCVLIGLAGQGKTRGTVAINYVQLCINQSIGAIYPSSEIFPEYLYYYLDSKYNYLRELSSGDGGRGGLNLKLIRNIEIEYPENIKEQKAIVDIICNIDNLIDSLQLLIDKKEKMKKQMMNILFNKNNYKSKPKNISLNKIGYTYNGLSGMNSDNFKDGNKEYITFLNVLNNSIIKENQIEKFNCNKKQNMVKKGDLFFNTSSETPEEVALCSTINFDVKELYLNSFCFGFRINDKSINNTYLSYFFRSKYGRNIIKNLAQGSTRYNLPKKKFLEYIFCIPSSIEEQGKYADILINADNEIEALKDKLSKYIRIKDGMMEELLTGKVRLSYE